LTDRAFRRFCKKHGVPRYEGLEVREQLREIHQLFKDHVIREA
jgi:hypothetical protein